MFAARAVDIKTLNLSDLKFSADALHYLIERAAAGPNLKADIKTHKAWITSLLALAKDRWVHGEEARTLYDDMIADAFKARTRPSREAAQALKEERAAMCARPVPTPEQKAAIEAAREQAHQLNRDAGARHEEQLKAEEAIREAYNNNPERRLSRFATAVDMLYKLKESDLDAYLKGSSDDKLQAVIDFLDKVLTARAARRTSASPGGELPRLSAK
jgi:hypothetical protein